MKIEKLDYLYRLNAQEFELARVRGDALRAGDVESVTKCDNQLKEIRKKRKAWWRRQDKKLNGRQ